MTETSVPKPRTPRWVKVFAIVGVVFAVLVVLLIAGVLGEGHGPGRHMSGRRGSNPEKSVGAPAASSQAARTIPLVTLDTMRFEPETVAVTAGEIVTFSVTNRGQTVHEFTIGDEDMHQKHAEMMSHIPAGMGHDTSNSITVQPGATKTLTWQFGSPGAVEYACHQAGHYQAGMRGRISVT